MPARELTVKRKVKAPPPSVWAVLTDLEHAPETLRGVKRIEILDGDRYAVGTRWVETRRMFGKDESQTLEVTDCVPHQRTAVEAHSAGVDYRTVYTLEPAEEGTTLTVVFGASHDDPNLLQRLTATVFGRVGVAVTTRLLAQDLADIARRAEGAS